MRPLQKSVMAKRVAPRPRTFVGLRKTKNGATRNKSQRGKNVGQREFRVGGEHSVERSQDFQAGDVGYVEKTRLHYIENTGETDLIFLEMFRSSFYQELSLSEWLTPHTTRTGKSTSQHRPSNAGRNTKGRVGDCAALVGNVTRG